MMVSRNVIGATAWLGVLAMLALALVASSHGLAAPTGWSLAELERWFEHQPVSATFRVILLGALLLVLYLIVSTLAVLLGACARAARLPHLGTIADLIAVPAVKRVVSGLLGLGITLSVGAPPAYAGGSAPSTAPDTIDEQPGGVATMRALDPGPEPGPAAPASAMPSTPQRWTIEPGDHLWGVADATLSVTHGRAPTDAEIAAFVHEIVELNQDVLVVPDHPDLVFPGQVFVLPATP